MDFINHLLNGLFDLMLGPLQSSDPWIAMCVATAFITALLLLVFKFTSRPEAIRQSKGRLIARTLELLLFQHDMGVSITAVGRILWANLLYLKELLIPLGVALLIAVPLLAQCAAWFEHRPLRLGESALLQVQLHEAAKAALTPVPQLTAPATVKIETKPLLVSTLSEINWRVSGKQVGHGFLSTQIAGQTLEKIVVVGDGLARVSPLRPGANDWWNRVLYPSEPAMRGAAVSAELHYPLRHWYVGTTDVHWLVALFVLSIVFGFALKKPLGVTL